MVSGGPVCFTPLVGHATTLYFQGGWVGGGGHNTLPSLIGNCPRPYLAFMEDVPPSKLCYVKEGGGLKGKASGTTPSEAFPPHRDTNDHGRIQCVVALSDCGFMVWPYSHKLALGTEIELTATGAFHNSQKLEEELATRCEGVVFSAKAGDVFLFVGGLTVHGVPVVGENHPSPRVVTYASFWPPGTRQGCLHEKKECSCYRYPCEPHIMTPQKECHGTSSAIQSKEEKNT